MVSVELHATSTYLTSRQSLSSNSQRFPFKKTGSVQLVLAGNTPSARRVPPPFSQALRVRECARSACITLRQYLSRDIREKYLWCKFLSWISFCDHNFVPFFLPLQDHLLCLRLLSFWEFIFKTDWWRFSIAASLPHTYLYSYIAWCTIPFWSVHVTIVSELQHLYWRYDK